MRTLPAALAALLLSSPALAQGVVGFQDRPRAECGQDADGHRQCFLRYGVALADVGQPGNTVFVQMVIARFVLASTGNTLTTWTVFFHGSNGSASKPAGFGGAILSAGSAAPQALTCSDPSPVVTSCSVPPPRGATTADVEAQVDRAVTSAKVVLLASAPGDKDPVLATVVLEGALLRDFANEWIRARDFVVPAAATPAPAPRPAPPAPAPAPAAATPPPAPRTAPATPAPAVAATPAPRPPAAVVPSATAGQTRAGIHVVQRGETTFSIARQYGLSVAGLQRLNPTLVPEKIEVGDELKVPVK